MDGKPLYEYARTNTPLPRPIEPRKCTVSALALVDWQDQPGAHPYAYPTARVEDPDVVRKMEALVRSSTSAAAAAPSPDDAPPCLDPPDGFPPAFTLTMTVSSGTYVRSIAHDLGLALHSAAHVVMLERTRQGDYVLDPAAAAGDLDRASKACVDWSVFQKAIDHPETRVGDEMLEWEAALLSVMDVQGS
jgi:tRNA pseudouridine55 synthase